MGLVPFHFRERLATGAETGDERIRKSGATRNRRTDLGKAEDSLTTPEAGDGNPDAPRGRSRDALSAHTASLSSHPQHGPFKLFAGGAKPRHVWKVARSLPC